MKIKKSKNKVKLKKIKLFLNFLVSLNKNYYLKAMEKYLKNILFLEKYFLEVLDKYFLIIKNLIFFKNIIILFNFNYVFDRCLKIISE